MFEPAPSIKLVLPREEFNAIGNEWKNAVGDEWKDLLQQETRRLEGLQSYLNTVINSGSELVCLKLSDTNKAPEELGDRVSRRCVQILERVAMKEAKQGISLPSHNTQLYTGDALIQPRGSSFKQELNGNSNSKPEKLEKSVQTDVMHPRFNELSIPQRIHSLLSPPVPLPPPIPPGSLPLPPTLPPERLSPPIFYAHKTQVYPPSYFSLFHPPFVDSDFPLRRCGGVLDIPEAVDAHVIRSASPAFYPHRSSAVKQKPVYAAPVLPREVLARYESTIPGPGARSGLPLQYWQLPIYQPQPACDSCSEVSDMMSSAPTILSLSSLLTLTSSKATHISLNGSCEDIDDVALTQIQTDAQTTDYSFNQPSDSDTCHGSIDWSSNETDPLRSANVPIKLLLEIPSLSEGGVDASPTERSVDASPTERSADASLIESSVDASLTERSVDASNFPINPADESSSDVCESELSDVDVSFDSSNTSSCDWSDVSISIDQPRHRTQHATDCEPPADLGLATALVVGFTAFMCSYDFTHLGR